MKFRIACLALSASVAALGQLSNAVAATLPPASLAGEEDVAALRENMRQTYIGDAAGAALDSTQNAPPDTPLIPFAWTEQKIQVTDGTGFGGSVAVFGDIAFVGAYSTDTNKGAVYVYQRSPRCSAPNVCAWNRKQRIVASDGAAYDYFGASIAFDGTTALIGALRADVDGRQDQGATYVFARDSSQSFVQTQKLTAPDGSASDCYFGRSVAVAGADALIGAPGCGGANQVINSRGSAYRYRRDANGNWTIAQKFVASDGGFAENFGRAVGISADTAVIGADSAFQFGYYGVGAAYVYSKQCFPDGRCNPNWLERQKLIGSPTSTGMEFGGSILFDGTTLLVGAEWALTGDESLPTQPTSGAVWVFKQVGGLWVQQQELVPSDAYHDWRFGGPIALSGKTLVVGATGAGWPNNMKGAAYVFELDGGVWTETQKLSASDGLLNDAFGAGVGIAASGDVIVGAPQGINNTPGAIYVYHPQ